MKNIRIFYLKISIFLVVKVSVYFNRRVFVMDYRINEILFRIWLFHYFNVLSESKGVINEISGVKSKDFSKRSYHLSSLLVVRVYICINIYIYIYTG